MPSPSNKQYSAAQAHAILRLAEKRKDAAHALSTNTADLSAAEIVETGRELGLDGEHIAAAMQQFEEDSELDQAQAELRQLSYRRFLGHTTAFAIVQALLFAIDLWVGKPLPLLLITIVWAGLLLLLLRGALFPDPEALRTRAKKRLLTKRLKASSRDFSDAVQSGAAKLLATSAKKIDQGVDRLTR